MALVSDKAAIAACAMFAASSVIYVMQRHLSPRLFLSTLFPGERPHDYFVTETDPVHPGTSEVCPVCYSEFNPDAHPEPRQDLPEVSDRMAEFLNASKPAVMRTPCNHFFHSSCLLTVMNYKPICPVCRSTLPPVDIDQ